jgi:quinol monooxygenase YgiN
MFVVIARFRVTSPQAGEEVCRLIHQSYEAYQSPGWGSGHCAVSLTDPLQFVEVELWGSRTAFEAWWNSPARVKYERQSGHLLVGSLEIELYEEL